MNRVGEMTMATTHSSVNTDDHVELDSHLDDYFVDPEEGRRMFDEAVREVMGISGQEFICRYDAGEYADIPDDLAHRHIIDLALLIPFGRADD